MSIVVLIEFVIWWIVLFKVVLWEIKCWGNWFIFVVIINDILNKCKI